MQVVKKKIDECENDRQSQLKIIVVKIVIFLCDTKITLILASVKVFLYNNSFTIDLHLFIWNPPCMLNDHKHGLA